MRRFFVLGLLFLLMLALQYLQVGVETAFNPLSLATFGFILLAAYTLGETASRIGLPKITGYIVTGLVFGPYVVNLFSAAVVSDLRVINSLAIGMIALSAGGEMKVPALRAIAKSLTLIVVVKGVLVLAAVTAAVYFIRPWLPFLADAPVPLVLAVGMIFGVLALGTSPAATIAVINETGSKGRLADTTLGVAVFKDVVMVVLLAIAIALAKVFSTEGGGGFDPHVLLLVGEELGLSILAGALLGGVIIAYIRYVHAEMWLFIIGIIFAMTAVSTALHLEALLLFIVAGFVVQNFSKHGDHFVHLVESVALPVYVVFFSVAGAGLDLGALAQVGLVALALVVVRLAAIFAGTGLATRLAGEPAAIRKNAWLAFVSQAGVVIGLTIIIERNLPALGPEIRTVVLGTVAINLIVGPILFKLALGRVGETAEARGSSEGGEAPAEEVEAGPLPSLPELPERIAFPEPAFKAPKLEGAARTVLGGLVTLRRDFAAEVVAPQTADLAAWLEGFRERLYATLDAAAADLGRTTEPAAQAGVLRRHRTELATWLQSRAIAFGHAARRAEAGRHAFETLFATVHDLTQQVAEEVEVLIEPERLQPQPDDPVPVRAWKAVKRAGAGVRRIFGSGLPPMRTVPMRRVVRYQLDGVLPGRLVHVAARVAAQPAYTLGKARAVFDAVDEQLAAVLDGLQAAGADGPAAHGPEAAERLRETAAAEFAQAEEDLRRYADEVEQRLAFELVHSYEAVLNDFRTVGTASLPARRRRISRVHEDSQQARRAVQGAFGAWQQATQGTAGALALHLEAVRLDAAVRAAAADTLRHVATRIRKEVTAPVKRARAACAEVLERLQNGRPDALLDAAALAAMQEDLAETMQRKVLEPLDRLRQQRALNALLDRMLGRFSELAAALPVTYEVASREALPEPGSGVVPGSVRIQEAPFRETARRFLETRATRNLAEANETLLRETAAVLDGLYAVDQQVRFNLQAALDELEADEPDAARATTLATEALQRACAHLGRLRTRSEAFAGAVHEQIAAATRGLIDPLEEEVAGQTGAASRLQREPRAALSRGASALARMRHFVRERYGVLRRWLGLWLRPFAREVRREMRASRGLDELEPAEVLQRRDQAAVSWNLTERLPFIYQKLFALTPLDADDFLVGREAQAETVALALRRWQAGVACSVAVVAEPGGGASSFLGRLRRSLPDEPPVAALRFAHGAPTEEALAKQIGEALGVPQLRSLHTLRRYLEAGAVAGPQARRFVVILEDLHHLYQRAPGGFDLLRQLGLLIAATGRQVFWVASVQTHAWRYIDAVTGLSDAFAFTVELPPLDPADLERAIVERHRLSGFSVTFEPAPLLAQRRRYRRADPERKQALARAEYFEQLHRLSGGNPYGALFLWLRSIERVEEDALVIAPLERFSYGYVRRLDPAALMTLRVVFQRGSLTPGEHARLFGLPEAESRTTLAHLTGLNLLAPAAGSNGSSDVFTIHRPAYRPLADELRALNLVE